MGCIIYILVGDFTGDFEGCGAIANSYLFTVCLCSYPFHFVVFLFKESG